VIIAKLLKLKFIDYKGGDKIQTIYLDNDASEIAEEIVEIVKKKMGIKIKHKELIPLIFESGPEVLADMCLTNLKKRLV
jgi:hypothetical protein